MWYWGGKRDHTERGKERDKKYWSVESPKRSGEGEKKWEEEWGSAKKTGLKGGKEGKERTRKQVNGVCPARK